MIIGLTAAKSEVPTGNTTAVRAGVPGSNALHVGAVGGTGWLLPVSDARSLVVTGTAS